MNNFWIDLQNGFRTVLAHPTLSLTALAGALVTMSADLIVFKLIHTVVG